MLIYQVRYKQLIGNIFENSGTKFTYTICHKDEEPGDWRYSKSYETQSHCVSQMYLQILRHVGKLTESSIKEMRDYEKLCEKENGP